MTEAKGRTSTDLHMRCLVVDDDPLSRKVIEHYIAQHDALELVASCESAIEAANVLQRQGIDLVFLDVEMPLMTGIELAKSLDERPQIVLVTAKEEYAIEAFDVEVTDYLLKPVAYARFLQAVQRAQRRASAAAPSASPAEPPPAAAPAPSYVFVRTEGRLVRLELERVLWIEAQGDYVMIHTSDKEKRYLVHATMKSMQDKLPDSAFVRVHRSYIVRLDRIDDIEDTTIVMDRKVIPIGASYKEALLRRLNTI